MIKEILEEMVLEKEYEMSEDDIREKMAESGKMKVKQLMDYMKAKYDGKYDPKLARANAKDIVAEM